MFFKFYMMVFLCVGYLYGQDGAFESVKRGLEKTQNLEGYNYTSSIKIAKISLSEEMKVNDAFKQAYVDKILGAIQGVSLYATGAVDYQQAKTEALYDLRYSQNNVDISLKFPLLIDYSLQRVYLGKSILTTFFPMQKADENKLINFDMNDSLVKSLSSRSIMLTPLELKKATTIYNEALYKAFTGVQKQNFSYKSSGSNKQKVALVLNHEESLRFLITIVDHILTRYKEEKLITEDEYAKLSFLKDQKGLSKALEDVVIKTSLELEIDQYGYISGTSINFNVTGNKGVDVVIEGGTQLSNYNTPIFSIFPEKLGSVDFKEILKLFEQNKKSSSAKGKKQW